MEISISSIRNWAESVREGYLVNGMEPNDMVEEIARANDLNPKQVDRLCQASNLAIKAAKRSGKVDDVMFPLADSREVIARLQPDSDWEEPMEGAKMASLAPESRASEFSRYFLTEHGRTGMSKVAGLNEPSARAHSAVLKEIDKRYSVKRRDLTTTKSAAAGMFNAIMDYLGDEAKVARSLNGSYTAAKMVLGDSDVVDDLYKIAHKMICTGHVFPYPEPEMVKTAGRVANPNSRIITYITKYASLLSEIERKEADLKAIDEERKTASRRFKEVMLREI